MFVSLCFAMYASVVAADPIGAYCVRVPAAYAHAAMLSCNESKDPLTTCEARRSGALKVFVTYRKLETS